MSSRAEMKTFSCIFPESVLYYKSTCRCDGMVDVVDSKCVASDFPSSGKGVANSLLFWYSDSSFINIPPAYPSCFFGSVRSRVFIKVCRCVGTGRRGGLKILWANPPCGFDSRHRHQNCFDALCFGAIFLLPDRLCPKSLRVARRNGICRRDLTGKIQMCVILFPD